MTGTPDNNTETSVSRSSGRSRGHGRHRHHRSHRSRHRNWFFGSKSKESNFVAAVCNMIVVVLICTALAEPQWFYVHGGSCRDQNGHTVEYLGMHMFLTDGNFMDVDAVKDGSDVTTLYKYGSSPETTLMNCVTKDIVQVIHSILAFCFLAIVMSILAFLFDLSAPTYKVLKIIRENALFSIATVLLCVVISGFCYWTTEQFEELLKLTKAHGGSKVEVQFSISFYLMTAAGSVAVIATACNLIRRPQTSNRPYHRYQPLRRSSYEDELEELAEEPPSFVTQREPPPYEP